jgi:hypothetical protein
MSKRQFRTRDVCPWLPGLRLLSRHAEPEPGRSASMQPRQLAARLSCRHTCRAICRGPGQRRAAGARLTHGWTLPRRGR